MTKIKMTPNLRFRTIPVEKFPYSYYYEVGKQHSGVDRCYVVDVPSLIGTGVNPLGLVAYCKRSREWLARRRDGRLWTSCAKTRQEAAAALWYHKDHGWR
jgi:hypothetical protein